MTNIGYSLSKQFVIQTIRYPYLIEEFREEVN